MKHYVRQIKPYIEPPALHGCNCSPDPVEGYNWVSEDMEEELRKEIIVSDSWSKLIFKERFVEGINAKWVRKEDSISYWYECSNCGCRPPKSRYGQDWYCDWCPDCGAAMKLEWRTEENF